jgi:hypothetical protein
MIESGFIEERQKERKQRVIRNKRDCSLNVVAGPNQGNASHAASLNHPLALPQSHGIWIGSYARLHTINSSRCQMERDHRECLNVGDTAGVSADATNWTKHISGQINLLNAIADGHGTISVVRNYVIAVTKIRPIIVGEGNFSSASRVPTDYNIRSKHDPAPSSLDFLHASECLLGFPRVAAVAR